MATKHRNLSQLNSPLPSAEEMKFGIVVAEWNPEVTEGLLSGAVHTLRSAFAENGIAVAPLAEVIADV